MFLPHGVLNFIQLKNVFDQTIHCGSHVHADLSVHYIRQRKSRRDGQNATGVEDQIDWVAYCFAVSEFSRLRWLWQL